ncbi:diaminopimelate epimerase [bacterium BMS3Bbin12]|nr:diaminopimelate epimerase [bacterium BMS3Abin12]GBE48869.1 diaminopimelate epimerase [bacterium BMS3Bbin12]GBE49773.1 diaminopimelate epimerase [bacterium BMS3Bbin13]HDK02310.1 diaminopimelate epimerase [Gammaproteobacteria bacterium]
MRFTKMQGLGNDFVVVDGLTAPLELSAAQVRRIADRRLGVGCDQLLVIGAPVDAAADFRYEIYNADGSRAEQCGNGVRCIVRYLAQRGLTDRSGLVLEGDAGRVRARIEDDGAITVDMGVPRLEPREIPFTAEARAVTYPLAAGGREVAISAVSMGNPHAVLIVDDIERAPVAELGPALEAHPRFPRRTNVGFLQVVEPAYARLRVYERGAGETPACGSGACAAVVAGRLRGLLGERVTVRLPGGELVILWGGEGTPVWMTGPAVSVFEGQIEP